MHYTVYDISLRWLFTFSFCACLVSSLLCQKSLTVAKKVSKQASRHLHNVGCVLFMDPGKIKRVNGVTSHCSCLHVYWWIAPQSGTRGRAWLSRSVRPMIEADRRFPGGSERRDAAQLRRCAGSRGSACRPHRRLRSLKIRPAWWAKKAGPQTLDHNSVKS